MRLSIAAAALIALFCGSTALAETVEVHGSTTVSNNLLTPKKAEIEKAAGVELQIVGNGSGRGLADLIEGKVKVAMISAPLADEVKSLKAKGTAFDETKLQAHQVGGAPAAFAVHPSNPVKSVSAEQMAGILSGKIKNWKEVGGPDKAIVVICAVKGDGVRSMIEQEFLAGGDIAAEKREVQNAPQAVKIVSQLDAAVAIMSKISITPEVVELNAGKAVVQPLILVTIGDPSPDVAKVIAAAKAASGA
ncbi:MAG TPA: substrate-binding domain-containing protein [Alphaproteobacteria bacterium]|nr:substrate-binding domain-containing protein [Alphaproteobacteria bacterium]